MVSNSKQAAEKCQLKSVSLTPSFNNNNLWKILPCNCKDQWTQGNRLMNLLVAEYVHQKTSSELSGSFCPFYKQKLFIAKYSPFHLSVIKLVWGTVSLY